MLIDIKMNKICSRSRSQWLFENLRRPGHLSPFLQNGRYIWIKFVWNIRRTLMLIGIKIKKKTKKLLTELGDSDCLKIHVNPSKIYVNPGI